MAIIVINMKHYERRKRIHSRLIRLVPKLKDSNIPTKLAILNEIRSFGKDAEPASVYILPLLHAPDEELRNLAVKTIVEISKGSSRIYYALKDMISKKNSTMDPYTILRIYWILERIEI